MQCLLSFFLCGLITYIGHSVFVKIISIDGLATRQRQTEWKGGHEGKFCHEIRVIQQILLFFSL